MCGIFGIIHKGNSVNNKKIKSISDDLFKLSAYRGKESSGFSVYKDNVISVYKKPFSPLKMTGDQTYKKFFKEENNGSFTLIGHSRLVTQGSLNLNNNNQPVIKNDLVCIHNGIIVNDKLLWATHKTLTKNYDVDTEVFLELINLFSKEYSFINSVIKTFQKIKGTASVAILSKSSRNLLLATNNGSLYLCTSTSGNDILFASERYILETALKRNKLNKKFDSIIKIEPNRGCLISLESLKKTNISFNEIMEDENLNRDEKLKSPLIIKDLSKPNGFDIKHTTTNQEDNDLIAELKDHHHNIKNEISKIKRCTKCVLPETMPFIIFNENGVCNYCLNYKKVSIKGKDELINILKKYKTNEGENDCIVSFSGGRDSSYGLHYIKNVLDMNPVAYSYDWGMVTDIGRRNQARMCGKLGIEHILVSADIKKKRKNIKKNILAWLKKPDLGTVPIFMAGDKQYFYHLNRLKKDMNIPLVIYGENPLEITEFKYGFCGIKPLFNLGEHGYHLGIIRKLNLGFYYIKKIIENPSYINKSLFDSMTAFISSYFMSHDYYYLFQYINWNENEIDSILLKKYEWEKANDTETTWRIGDGTAPFYNYIYYVIAGFTENDTFRSNQIREGVISRETAIELTNRDNKPRWESIKWYCNTIGVDFKFVIKSINKIPKLY